jgi:hypothetical protein
VRSPALSLARTGAACALLLVALPSAAHLQPTGAASLVAMIAAADAMVVARAVQPTHERSATEAATAFVARETIAGDGPTGGFVLEQRAPLLRYGELSDALVLLAKETADGRPASWVSVQPAGAAILLDPVNLTDDTRATLRDLWAALHPPGGGEPDPSRVAEALVAALAQPQRKLRALAFLDLAALAADPQHLTQATVERLRRYGDGPGDDPQLAPAVRALGDRLAPGPGVTPRGGTT